MSRLSISDITVRPSSITIAYRSPNGAYRAELAFRQPIAKALARYPADKIERLLNITAVAFAAYLFDYEYFTEIAALHPLTQDERALFEDFFFSGLAEFRHRNNIPIGQKTKITSGKKLFSPVNTTKGPVLNGALVTNGGGKDGATAIEAMHSILGSEIDWFTLEKVGSRIGLIAQSPIHSNITADRLYTIDPPKKPQYKGHKPFSGFLACAATIAALVAGRKYVTVANEYSANEGNFVLDGVSINHQYTKSFAFERSIHRVLADIGLGTYYFSAVRPLFELQILAILRNYPQYHRTFVSCNVGVYKGHWCLACAKCAFIVLAVTALDPAMAERIWGDKLVIARPQLKQDITALIAPHLNKPFECVGTLEECQLAAGMIRQNKTYFSKLPRDLQSELRLHSPTDFDSAYRNVFTSTSREENFPPELRAQLHGFFQQKLAT